MIDIACTEYLIEIAEKKKGDFVYKKGNSQPEGINWAHGPSPGCTGQLLDATGNVAVSYIYVGFLARYLNSKEHCRTDYQHIWVRKDIFEPNKDYTPESTAFTQRMLMS